MRIFLSSLSLLLVSLGSLGVYAQQMTASDRLAMLYAPQLNFSREGGPIIRVGILEARKSVTFTPDMPIRVMPSGNGGPEIELPANLEYTIRATDPKKGKYRHLVVVNRLPVSQIKRVDKIKKLWLGRGFIPEVIEVGGLFAIAGKVFDSRTIMVAVGGAKSRAAARKIKRQLESKYGIEGAIHSEVIKYPSNHLTLTGKGVDIAIRTQSVLWIAGPKGKETDVRFKIPKIAKSYGKGFETRYYTGTFIVAPDNDGTIVGMVSLDAERLLKGVVPAETYRSAPKHALRAQAVAARNEIFSAIGVRNLAEPYMLRGDVMDQVYGGVGVEHPKTSAAVDATRGQVMFYGQKIIEATYSSNAGGFTENNENVWDMEPRPWLRGKPDTFGAVPKAFRDGISPSELEAFLASDFPTHSRNAPVSSTKLYRWKKTVDISKVQAWLTKNGRKIGRLKDVTIDKRGYSGRVVRLTLTGDRGKTIVERELNARRLFGGLRSGLFTMKIHRDSKGYATKFDFSGAGFGHGVGMCQTGATGMAANGKTYREILQHYYTDIKVERLYK